MLKMIADKAFSYRGVALQVGDEFDADDEHVNLFSLIGHAHVKRSQQYETKVMTAGGSGSRKRQARPAH